MGRPKGCVDWSGLFVGVGFGLEGFGSHKITEHGENDKWEYWAEAVTDWVYKGFYTPKEHPPGEMYKTTPDQRDYIIGVFRGP